MSKVLWIGDGGSATGFARVSHAIGDRLVENFGDEVHLLATNYRGDPYPTKVQMYVPTIRDPADTYGMGRFLELAQQIQPDVVVMLNDPQVLYAWLLNNRHDPERLLLKAFPTITYIPIDGYNNPTMYSVLGQVTNQVAMSKHGQAAMPESRLIYHGVDTDLFWPVSGDRPITTSGGDVLRTKKDCKRAFGFDAESFVIGRVDRNGGRKDYPATWKAVLPVLRRHSDITVYFHCKAKDEQSGVNLPALFSRDLDLMARFRVPGNRYNSHTGYSQQDLNAIYNAFDLFVSTSRGEGFGMTIAEALACEVPVIAQNVSAIPEVVGPGGELIEPEREITVPFGQDQWLADINAFTDAIERAYGSRSWRRETGKAGREHVIRTFNWDEAAASFHEYISELAAQRREVLAHAEDSADEPGVDPGADEHPRPGDGNRARRRRRALAP
jgi:glycosyltransferase involved in cell wall biosynthesis